MDVTNQGNGNPPYASLMEHVVLMGSKVAQMGETLSCMLGSVKSAPNIKTNLANMVFVRATFVEERAKSAQIYLSRLSANNSACASKVREILVSIERMNTAIKPMMDASPDWTLAHVYVIRAEWRGLSRLCTGVLEEAHRLNPDPIHEAEPLDPSAVAQELQALKKELHDVKSANEQSHTELVSAKGSLELAMKQVAKLAVKLHGAKVELEELANSRESSRDEVATEELAQSGLQAVDIECGICQSEWHQPVRLSCAGAHVFCQDCIFDWFDVIPEYDQKTCPMCREVIHLGGA